MPRESEDMPDAPPVPQVGAKTKERADNNDDKIKIEIRHKFAGGDAPEEMSVTPSQHIAITSLERKNEGLLREREPPAKSKESPEARLKAGPEVFPAGINREAINTKKDDAYLSTLILLKRTGSMGLAEPRLSRRTDSRSMSELPPDAQVSVNQSSSAEAFDVEAHPGAYAVSAFSSTERQRSIPSLVSMIPSEQETSYRSQTPLISATLVDTGHLEVFAEAKPIRKGRSRFLVVLAIAMLIAIVVAVVVTTSGGSKVASNDLPISQPPAPTDPPTVAPTIYGEWGVAGHELAGLASNEFFGASTAISADGTIVAGGAPGGQVLAGIVRVYRRSDTDGTWSLMGNQSAMVGVLPGDLFGFSVALSRDGMTVASGAIILRENTADSGYVSIFRFDPSGQIWRRLGGPIHGTAAGEQFGNTVSLSDDGDTIIIGAPFNNENGFETGLVKSYHFNGTIWEPLGDVKHGANPGDEFGVKIDISADGLTFVAGANQYRAEDDRPGYVRVFHLQGDSWVQIGDDLVGAELSDEFGWYVSLSDDASVLAVSSVHAKSLTGQVSVYEFVQDSWRQLGQTMVGRTEGDNFGISLDMSGDGRVLAIGAWREDSTEVQPNYARVYRLDENRTRWLQIGEDIVRVDPQGGAIYVEFGIAISLSKDGRSVAMGSMYDNFDNSASNSGEVTVYELKN
jgi:hypothetical protein